MSALRGPAYVGNFISEAQGYQTKGRRKRGPIIENTPNPSVSAVVVANIPRGERVIASFGGTFGGSVSIRERLSLGYGSTGKRHSMGGSYHNVSWSSAVNVPADWFRYTVDQRSDDQGCGNELRNVEEWIWLGTLETRRGHILLLEFVSRNRGRCRFLPSKEGSICRRVLLRTALVHFECW